MYDVMNQNPFTSRLDDPNVNGVVVNAKGVSRKRNPAAFEMGNVMEKNKNKIKKPGRGQICQGNRTASNRSGNKMRCAER